MSRGLEDFLQMAKGLWLILAVILFPAIPVLAVTGYGGHVETFEHEIAPPRADGAPLMVAEGRGGEPMSDTGKADRGVETYQNLTPEEKALLKRKYREWRSLSPEEKQALRRRMNEWQTLSDHERRLYRQRYDQWQQISPEERQELRKKLENWESLSPGEKEGIRRRFKE